mgnify:CR=1 FL=1
MSYKSEKADKKFELIPDGKYRAKIERIEERANFDGSATIMEIRWRLSGNTNRIYFDKINKDKNFPNDYNHWKVSTILYACKCPDENTTEDVIKALENKEALLTIGHQHYDKTGKDYNRVDSYDRLDEGTAVGEPVEVKSAKTEDVSQKDLPF